MDDKELEYLIKDHGKHNDNMDKLVDFVRGEGPDYMIYGRYSLLITAVSYNKYDIAELFLDMGADINMQNPRGETPLYIVCREYDKSIDLLLLLLNRGAKINEVIRFGGTTALEGAINHGTLERVKLLLEYGADPNLGDQHNNRPLQNAATENIDMVKILLEYGADINGTNDKGYTALLFACITNNYDIIDMLLEYGIDPFILSNDNEHIFTNHMLEEDVKEIIEKKINELHKLNVSYDMIEIAKGIQEDPLDELTDDVLEVIYNYLINMPYNPKKTRLRMAEDLEDIDPYMDWLREQGQYGSGFSNSKRSSQSKRRHKTRKK